MVQDKSAGVSMLDKYRQRATDRKGRRSIDVLPSIKGSGADKGSASPSHKSKKRPSDGGNIATTTRSTGSLPTPPPCWEVVEADSPSPRRVERVVGPPEAGAKASPSPLNLLGWPSIHMSSSRGPP